MEAGWLARVSGQRPAQLWPPLCTGHRPLGFGWCGPKPVLMTVMQHRLCVSRNWEDRKVHGNRGRAVRWPLAAGPQPLAQHTPRSSAPAALPAHGATLDFLEKLLSRESSLSLSDKTFLSRSTPRLTGQPPAGQVPPGPVRRPHPQRPEGLSVRPPPPPGSTVRAELSARSPMQDAGTRSCHRPAVLSLAVILSDLGSFPASCQQLTFSLNTFTGLSPPPPPGPAHLARRPRWFPCAPGPCAVRLPDVLRASGLPSGNMPGRPVSLPDPHGWAVAPPASSLLCGASGPGRSHLSLPCPGPPPHKASPTFSPSPVPPL